MRRLPPCLSLLVCLLIARSAPAATHWQAMERVPGHDPVLVSVEGKTRTYFRLDPVAPLEISISGPSRLQIVTRAEVGGAVPAASYRVWIEENGTRIREQLTRSAPATRAVTAKGGGVCKSRTLTYSVPSGRHGLRLYGAPVASGEGQGASGVLARIRVADDPTARIAMVSLTPVDAARSVTLAEGETLIPYYTVVPKTPVRVRVVGPTDLELTTRLDFDSTMRGAQSYRVEVWESGRRIREIDLLTTKSSAASYTDLKDRVASKGSRIHIPIENGTHELSIRLVQPKRGSAEIHLRIPQPLVGAER